MTTIFSTATGL
jgi:methylated-DNA-protein-cysteine methyltransferase related protein